VSDEANDAEVYLYVISCGLERVKIGVAGDAEKRLRELQVGSPVELKLALTRPYPERRDADAVAEELYRYFAGRRVRGSWYRLSAAEVRERLGQRASLEAPARARAAAEAASERRAPRRGGAPVRARTEKQLAYELRRRQERTRKQQRAARLLGQGMTQQAVAAELGVTTRTLRNWKAAPAFQRERERQHKHTARRRTAPHSKLKPPTRRDAKDTRRDRSRRSRPTAEQTPAIDVDQAERERPALAAEQQANGANPPRSPAASQHQGVPIFPNTPDGRAARLTYYEARKLNNPPNSLYDYHDAKRGLEPPAERRAREQRDTPQPR
jgi:hypothetical protein